MSERASNPMGLVARIWTDSVAYVALAIGAGLSIAGNVADTYRVRGQATDTLDIVMAVAWPALVLLMVEIFVSTRWIGLSAWMQALRWLGCLSIGVMAMRVNPVAIKMVHAKDNRHKKRQHNRQVASTRFEQAAQNKAPAAARHVVHH